MYAVLPNCSRAEIIISYDVRKLWYLALYRNAHQIYFKPKKGGGITFNAVVPLTKVTRGKRGEGLVEFLMHIGAAEGM